MLPAVHRMRNASDFATAVRRGRRVRRGSLVLHVCAPPMSTSAVGSGVVGFSAVRSGAVGSEADGFEAVGTNPRPVTVGFVVAKSVGNSVVRHRVARRLRAVVAPQLPGVAPGTLLVVRALPDAARASSAELAADLAAALMRAA